MESRTQISKPSAQSLFLQLQFTGNNLASGTGFIADTPCGPALITNRHNVTGRNNITNKPLSSNGLTPDSIVVVHNRKGNLGQWIDKNELLFDEEGKPKWIEHPIFGATVDFVALPLTKLTDIDLFPHTLGVNDPQILVAPSDTVSVVGFPFGLSGGGSYAIWATGFMATEPDINHNNLPTFLIDCRARPGQSGSAVIAHRNAGMIAMENGGSNSFGGPITKFLGIYSGRINAQSDLGIVWKGSAIKELTDSMREN